MKRTLFILIILSAGIFAQYKVEWTSEYTSPGNISIDKSQFIAVDKNGNVLVTGVTNSSGINDDLATIKYDNRGKQLWAAVYNGTGNYHDRPGGMVIDSYGNVYITGGSTGDGGTATDYFTVKYDHLGNEMWVSRFTSSGGIHDQANSIAIDGLGNIYVTGGAGHIVTDNSGMDWYTIKYDNDGRQIWAVGYDDNISTDEADALTVDDYGNVYVTGRCGAPAYHIAVIKYDSTGEKKWIAKYDGNAVSDDKPVSIKVDKQGLVHITGYSSELNRDFVTIIYDNKGNEVWKKNFNGPANMNDEAESMLIDENGNAYILGYSTVKKNHRNRCLLKYDISGNEKWNVLSDQSVKLTDQGIAGLKMAFDIEGNILVTGSRKVIYNKYPTLMVIDCYSKDGILLWEAYHSKENSIPVAAGIASDLNGNVYLTGYIINSNNSYDFCTVKFAK
ncbi:MAG TPA: SBBP repeat-containing protein [Ignavibacteria bacterium]|nr:SBBP repeat-containing protein [Ignavibacteria bacterium]HMQ99035.1 SBBP repeat-containing protein [Ignavibacteria bacterium]